MIKPATLTTWVVGLATFSGYVASAPRTITWWDGSHYPFLSWTLGITNPPGSLLLTLLGWLGTRIVFAPPVAFQFNLLACVIGAGSAALVTRIAMRLAGTGDRPPDGAALLGGAAAGLGFAVSFHAWTYGTQFTPYTLTVLFTGLIAWVLLLWWDRAEKSVARRELFVLLLLFGLDFSAHRTNLLWLPAALLAVALRQPRALVAWRTWVVAGAGLVLGLSFQLGYVVLSRREPFLDLPEPRTLGALWRYVSLDNLGGGFLIDLWPRRADFVQVQLADWLRFLWHNLGEDTATRVALALLALAGFASLARRSRRLALVVALCFFAAGLGAVAYFNRPASYFRPLDRHYLPSWTLLAPLAGVGLAAAARSVGRVAPAGMALAAAGVLALLLTASAWRANAPSCDRSATRYAETFARDLLEPLPPDAVLVTNGDNDTFPLLYLQWVEHVRPDVLVLNEAIASRPCVERWLRRADPAFASLVASEHTVDDVLRLNAWRRPVYFAVTLDPGLHTEVRGRGRLAGLAWRIPAPGDSTAGDGELERFIHERLPRAGLADRRQVLEPEIGTLLGNYVAAGMQLAMRQGDRGEAAQALATLDLVARSVALDRTGAAEPEVRRTLAGLRSRFRAEPPRRD